MAKSKRKTPIFGGGGGHRASEKQDKRRANKLFRTKCRDIDPFEETCDYPKKVSEVSDVWGFLKDGKVYIQDPADKLMRK